ncbi:hypothetical protein PPL_10221 [Heterostelium album PN500]|uniref:Uncharacterized protein n=1 Tax=Heterostelium pallidum (strain ATCC 26659 / Pp 5 / PN500) TaxID=670386 RepID=D3BQN5_HETP5|nr:hypothetical protein PPL_10221 [Heterostelium album PN500]EFA76455.1 hypothetical protein PPL_10221 [Heterostelium album PN500]|eukprot:XP_020428587.1 hypothetical protein PPL_10221 [Heterostelium album PN500]
MINYRLGMRSMNDFSGIMFDQEKNRVPHHKSNNLNQILKELRLMFQDF